MSWTRWPLKLWSNEQPVLDSNRVYLKVEFMTQQEKVKKDLVLGPLLQQAQRQPNTLILYQQHYRVSHRFTFKSPNTTQPHEITLKQLLSHIILTKDESTKQFYQTYIDGIRIVMKDNKELANNDVIGLYNETEVNCYQPGEIVEIIYYEKSLWERIKSKTANAVKKIPSLMVTLLEKLFGFVLMLLGLNGGVTSIAWKFLPSKKIIEWLMMLVAMFFPILGPVLGVGKMFF